MPLTNPIVVGFAKVLDDAQRKRQIVERDGKPMQPPQFQNFKRQMFGVRADANYRRELIMKVMKQYKHEYRVQFPKTVWKGFAGVAKNLQNKGFWDHVLDGVIEVTSSPIFSAVIGIATAAIPGVGAVLAPVAVILQRKVTEMVKDARDGKLDAKKTLMSAAEVAAAAGSAAATSSPAAAEMVVKAKQIVAIARTVDESPEARALRHDLLKSRKIIVQAQSGDAHAAAHIQTVTAKAKQGHEPSIKQLALFTAIAKGIRDGHIPRATKAEKKHYGKKAILKFGRLSPALQALARAAAHKSSPVASLPSPQVADSASEPPRDEGEYDDELRTEDEREFDRGNDAVDESSASYDDDTGAVTFFKPGSMRPGSFQTRGRPKKGKPMGRLHFGGPLKPAKSSPILSALTARKIAAVKPAIAAALARGDKLGAAETLAAAKADAREEAASVSPTGAAPASASAPSSFEPDEDDYEDEDDYDDEDAA